MTFWEIAAKPNPLTTACGMTIQLRYGDSLQRHTWKDDNRRIDEKHRLNTLQLYEGHYIMKLATYTYKDRTRVGAVVEDRIYLTSELDSMQYMIRRGLMPTRRYES